MKPSALRRTITGAFAVGCFILPAVASVGVAQAEDPGFVENLDVSMVVTERGSLEVTEEIGYVFTSPRRGIYRDLVVEEPVDTGGYRTYEISNISVTMNGGPVPVREEMVDGFLRLRIGDPNGRVSGSMGYTVSYTVSNALRTLTESDVAESGNDAFAPGDVELYWDAVGLGWDVPIYSGSVTVVGPTSALASECWVGGFGEEAPCVRLPNVPTSEVSWSWSDSSALGSGRGMTIAVAWSAAAFTDITPPQYSALSSTQRKAVTASAVGLVALVIPIILAFVWRRRDAGADVGAAPPQYGPPEGARPAEVAAALDGELADGGRLIVSTLLDLAARGYLRLDVAKDSLLVTLPAQYASIPDFALLPASSNGVAIADWEASLLTAVFSTDSIVRNPDGSVNRFLDGRYDPMLSSWVGYASGTLVAEAKTRGWRNKDGGVPDRRWTITMWTGIGLVFLAWIVNAVAGTLPGLLVAAIGAGAAIGSFFARIITPRQETPKSARFVAKTRGLKAVLGTPSAQERSMFAQKTGLSPAALLATMLPYAVILEVEREWVAGFPDVTPDEAARYGIGDIGGTGLLYSIGSVTSTMSSITTAPSSSGSGFSGGSGFGGGGFSGGGGGGGGGGSW